MDAHYSYGLLDPSERARVVVRVLTGVDTDFSGHLHADALSVGLYPRLGPRYLSAYHRSFIDSPYATALVATLDGARVGVLLGTLDTARHRAWVVHHRAGRLVSWAALAIALRPRVAMQFASTRTGRYLRLLLDSIAIPPATRVPPLLKPAVLSHVAVVEAARRAGVGSALLQAFEASAIAAGNTTVVLQTIADSSAEQFYASRGWRVVGHLTNLDGVALTRCKMDV